MKPYSVYMHTRQAILVNIFGGIMKCDVIAEGVVAATKEVRPSDLPTPRAQPQPSLCAQPQPSLCAQPATLCTPVCNCMRPRLV